MHRQAGFTLIELMLAILIMGVVTTWIVASLPSVTPGASAQRLALAANTALRQAHTLNVPFRLTISMKGWCLGRLNIRYEDKAERLLNVWQKEKSHCEMLPSGLHLRLAGSTEPLSEQHFYFMPSAAGKDVPVQVMQQSHPAYWLALSEGSYIAEPVR